MRKPKPKAKSNPRDTYYLAQELKVVIDDLPDDDRIPPSMTIQQLITHWVHR
jgi:hypothetical protein